MRSRRRLLAAGMVTVGVLAGAVTPGVSAAAPDEEEVAATGPPRVTATEILPPEGYRIERPGGGAYQIDDGGTVLLHLRPREGGIHHSALWRRGTFERIDPPEAPAPDVLDLSDRGRYTTGRVDRPPCDHPWWCPRPFVWHGGEATLLPTGGLPGHGLRVDDRGRVVVGQLELPCDPGFACPSELVAWIEGELVRPPTVAGAVPQLYPYDLNNRGQVAVSLLADDGTSHAAVWHVGGEMVRLVTAEGVRSTAVDINDRGDVVGWRGPASDLEAGGGFLWRDGEMVDLGSAFSPGKVNDRGQVVGSCATPDRSRYYACLWDDGELIDLGTPDGLTDAGIIPVDVNDHGQVVGYGRTAADRVRKAYLWQDGHLVDLGAVAGAHAASAVDIEDLNDRGQILGTIRDPGVLARDRPVVWTMR